VAERSLARSKSGFHFGGWKKRKQEKEKEPTQSKLQRALSSSHSFAHLPSRALPPPGMTIGIGGRTSDVISKYTFFPFTYLSLDSKK